MIKLTGQKGITLLMVLILILITFIVSTGIVLITSLEIELEWSEAEERRLEIDVRNKVEELIYFEEVTLTLSEGWILVSNSSFSYRIIWMDNDVCFDIKSNNHGNVYRAVIDTESLVPKFKQWFLLEG